MRDSAAHLLELTPEAPEGASAIVRSIENAEQLVDFLAPNLNVDLAQKQGPALTTLLAVLFFLVSVVFVYRSFYSMRIPGENSAGI